MEKKKETGWFIRCEVNGRKFEIRTASPLPRDERNAAKIIARRDLSMIVDPRGAVLVWLEEEVVAETHNLQPVTKPRSALDYELDLILRTQQLEAGEEADETAAVLLKKWYGVTHSDDPAGELAQRNKDSRDE